MLFDNKSIHDLFVMFYIDFKINVVKNLGSSFNISVKNIDNNETLTGSVQFANYDSDGCFFGLTIILMELLILEIYLLNQEINMKLLIDHSLLMEQIE